VRIVDVNEFYSPTGGGVRSYIDRKFAVMAGLGHELIVVAPGREDRIERRAGNGRVIYVKAPAMPFDSNYGLFWDSAPITALLDRIDPDVVECCSPWRPAWIVGNWQGRALKSFFLHNDNIATYAQRWFEGVASPARIERAFGWYSRYMRRFLDRFDTVVSNGPNLVRRMAARGIHVDAAMPLGIERERFSPALRDAEMRAAMLAECGLPPEAALLLGIGRHHPEKRWPMVIDAVEHAARAHPIGFVLIGHGVESSAVERRVAGNPHIRLYRAIDDRHRLARLMASCDAFIHGCEAETFGLVVSEALASGAPLIVPDEGGAAEVARPAFAEIYAARDTRACSAAITRLLSREPAGLRDAAAKAAAHLWSDRDHAVALTDYYARCIARRDEAQARRSA
jgi:alpha-1,6-mannosyltransferase